MAAFPMVLGSRFPGFGSSASTPPPTAPAAGVFRICRRRARRSRSPRSRRRAAGRKQWRRCCARILASGLGPVNPVISSLPLVELPASPHGHLLAIVFSGDGGWRDLDKTIAEKLQSAGVSVVGWDSLRYFWSHKSPEQTARDLGAVIDTYSARWGTSKVALIGYSFGAGVLPFAYDRLSPEAKQHVVQLSLLGFEPAADFEISLMGWLGAPPTKNALPTEPALAPINPSMIQCFYGKDEKRQPVPVAGCEARGDGDRNRGRSPFQRRLRPARPAHSRRLPPPRRMNSSASDRPQIADDGTALPRRPAARGTIVDRSLTREFPWQTGQSRSRHPLPNPPMTTSAV